MNNEINAVELSDLELDTVAGGFAISIAPGQNLALDTNSSFSQKTLGFGQSTFSGPNGSGTTTLVSINEIFTDAGQNLAVGN
jgi:hypothetical protein